LSLFVFFSPNYRLPWDKPLHPGNTTGIYFLKIIDSRGITHFCPGKNPPSVPSTANNKYVISRLQKKWLRNTFIDESKVGANIERKSAESCLRLLESDAIGIPSDLVNMEISTVCFDIIQHLRWISIIINPPRLNHLGLKSSGIITLDGLIIRTYALVRIVDNQNYQHIGGYFPEGLSRIINASKAIAGYPLPN
jgi:hypothetical protein